MYSKDQIQPLGKKIDLLKLLNMEQNLRQYAETLPRGISWTITSDTENPEISVTFSGSEINPNIENKIIFNLSTELPYLVDQNTFNVLSEIKRGKI